MSAVAAWVVGAGGLLGSHLLATLRSHPSTRAALTGPAKGFSWSNRDALAFEFDQGAARFAAHVRADQATQWAIIWAAGAGVVASTPQALAGEHANWRLFLETLTAHPLPGRGVVFMASSAGGVYAGAVAPPFSESSEPAPVSEYGRAKLDMEQTFREWTTRAATARGLVGRISNLFGPGQNLAKQQGLISQVSRCLIFNRPIHLYVPPDTVRDFVFASDCAEHIVDCVHRVLASGLDDDADRFIMKIFASEQSCSLRNVIELLGDVAHRQPRVLGRPSAGSRQQPRVLAFRSRVMSTPGPPRRTALQVALHRLHQHQMGLFCRGLLPPPQ